MCLLYEMGGESVDHAPSRDQSLRQDARSRIARVSRDGKALTPSEIPSKCISMIRMVVVQGEQILILPSVQHQENLKL